MPVDAADREADAVEQQVGAAHLDGAEPHALDVAVDDLPRGVAQLDDELVQQGVSGDHGTTSGTSRWKRARPR